MDQITNFLQINNNIYTAGQPRSNQFSLLKPLKISTVINLALPTTEGAIKNEAEIVTLMGMTYIQIPVDFQGPQVFELKKFFKAMELGLDDPIFIHCMLNMRVSVFIYLYRINKLKELAETAWKDVLKIWDPDEIWTSFIKENTL
ncbi:MAG: protein tyrosine phosphatase family protein [Spirochaetales bacterium]|nr:protein tyrosine phosphatase family protein [Spirochaetales bacterium]